MVLAMVIVRSRPAVDAEFIAVALEQIRGILIQSQVRIARHTGNLILHFGHTRSRSAIQFPLRRLTISTVMSANGQAARHL